MRIAINTRFSAYEYLEGYGRFSREISHGLATANPGDEFCFYYDQPSGQDTPQPANVNQIVVGPPARHPLLWKYWYDLRIPKLLLKHQADVFLSTDGICSLNTKVPQVLAIHDLAFLHYPQYLPKAQQWFYKQYTPRFIKKARRIITVSSFSRSDLLKQYPFAKDKIDVVYNAADASFRPLAWSEKEAFKEAFTEGREYFLYVGSIHPRKNLINLLRAFSGFKKRQKTNMQLVVAGRMAWQHDEFTQALSTFKFRNDVKLTGYIPQEEMVKLMGSAYALVYPSLWEGFGMPVLEAMQSGVPVLCSGNSALPEITGDAALYFDPLKPEDIGLQMAHVYKDEHARSLMIERGLQRAGMYHWNQSCKLVREILQDAASG
jgi:glycosyltransferase involved in cell wall biosynthesis